MNEYLVEKIVIGALKQTIQAHGPIHSGWISSAAKRIAHQLYGEFLALAAQGDAHEVCAAKITRLKEKIKDLAKEKSNLNKSMSYWMKLAKERE